MIRVVCCELDDQLDISDLPALLARVPTIERERIQGLSSRAHALASAVGWHLLVELCAAVTTSREVLQRDLRGRPCVRGAGRAVDVSLSHSDRYVVAAVSTLGQVGVDVELRRDVTPGVEERCFTPRELRWLRACPDPKDAFFRLWTLKEAYLKATGEGLATDPRRLELRLTDATATLEAPTNPGPPWRFGSWRLAGAWLSVCVQGGDVPADIEPAPPLVRRRS